MWIFKYEEAIEGKELEVKILGRLQKHNEKESLLETPLPQQKLESLLCVHGHVHGLIMCSEMRGHDSWQKGTPVRPPQ